MAGVEYLDPEIANEGQSANNWAPGDWTNSPNPGDEEWQPDMEPPHVNDYAALKKHKHYRKYFQPYRYVAFPAWIYHPDHEPKLIAARGPDGQINAELCKAEVAKLGPGWSPTPPAKKRLDMTGKSHPVKSDTQRLTEALVAGLTDKQGTPPSDPNQIAAIVAAVMAAVNSQPKPQPRRAAPEPEDLMPIEAEAATEAPAPSPTASPDVERAALLELAEKNGVEIDKRWGNERIKKVLNLV